MVTVVIDKDAKVLGNPIVSAIGLFDKDSVESEDLVGKVRKAVEKAHEDDKSSDDRIAELVRQTVRKYVVNVQGNKPVTEVHLLRV